MTKSSCCGTGGPGLTRRRFLVASAAASAWGPLAARLVGADDQQIPPRDVEAPRLFAAAPCGNAPFGGPFYRHDATTRAARTKALFDKDRAWPVGQEIVVKFLNGQGDRWVEGVQQKVREIAPIWSEYANLNFRFVDGGPHHLSVNFYPFTDPSGVRFGYGLFNSFVGTDTVKYLRAGVASMNLVFDPNMPPPTMESEFHRLILHEFGHAIGLIHEHQRRDRSMVWVEDVLYRYANDNWGWTKDDVDQQILSTEALTNLGGTVFDENSIMMYEYPRGLAYYPRRAPNGTVLLGPDNQALPDYTAPFASPNNDRLTALDKVAACITYPFDLVASGEDGLTPARDPAPTAGTIQQPGQVVRYRFPANAGDTVTIKTDGPDPTLVALLRNAGQPADRGGFANILRAFETTDDGTGSITTKLPENGANPAMYHIEVRPRSPRSRRMKTDFKISVTV